MISRLYYYFLLKDRRRLDAHVDDAFDAMNEQLVKHKRGARRRVDQGCRA